MNKFLSSERYCFFQSLHLFSWYVEDPSIKVSHRETVFNLVGAFI